VAATITVVTSVVISVSAGIVTELAAPETPAA
jgi:hypothetical protein